MDAQQARGLEVGPSPGDRPLGKVLGMIQVDNAIVALGGLRPRCSNVPHNEMLGSVAQGFGNDRGVDIGQVVGPALAIGPLVTEDIRTPCGGPPGVGRHFHHDTGLRSRRSRDVTSASTSLSIGVSSRCASPILSSRRAGGIPVAAQQPTLLPA